MGPRRGRFLHLLLLFAGAAGCGGEPPAAAPAPASAPRPDPPGPAAAEAEDADVPGAPRPPAAAAPGEPRPPLPPRPRGEGERLAALLRILEASGDLDLIRFAQDTLAAFPDRDAAAAALDRAGRENLRSNPMFVVNLLGCVRDAETGKRLEPFLVACMESEDPQVKRLAVGAYAATVPGASLERIASLAADGWSPVAMAAMEGLERRAAEAGAGPAARALLAVLPRVDRFARPAALLALGRLGDPAAIPVLEKEARAEAKGGEEGNPGRFAAAMGLALLGDGRGVEALRTQVLAQPLERPSVSLDDPGEWGSSPEAILARARDPGMRDRLLRQARESSGETAGAALRLLLEYPWDAAAEGALEAVLAAPDWRSAVEGLTVLRELGREDALPRALEALRAPEPGRRYGAALALARFRDPAAVAPLAARLPKEPDEGVARKIADALGILADPAAAPALVAFMAGDRASSPDGAIRAFSARLNLRGPLAAAAAPDLRALVRAPPSPAVLAHAVRALGQGPPAPETRTLLEEFLSRPDAGLREQAALALGDLGAPEARSALAGRYAREPDPGVADALRTAVLRVDLRNP